MLLTLPVSCSRPHQRQVHRVQDEPGQRRGLLRLRGEEVVDASADRGERRERRRPQRPLGAQTHSPRRSPWTVQLQPPTPSLVPLFISLFIYLFIHLLIHFFYAGCRLRGRRGRLPTLRFPLVGFFFCAAACDARATGCDCKHHRAAAGTLLHFLLLYVSCVGVATAFRVVP